MRWLALLALPFVAIAAVVAPMFGIHFCAEEAVMVSGGIVSLPIVGPYIKARLKRNHTAHCCNEEHKAAEGLIRATKKAAPHYFDPSKSYSFESTRHKKEES